ncbi:MAG: hypothetical protein RR614_10715 [Eubacterium sp.]
MKKSKIISVLALLVLCIGLVAGCSGGSDSDSSSSDSSSSSSSTPSSSTSSSTTEQYSQDFKLINATGVEIYGVFVSPVGVDSWEEDVMGQDTLADGAFVDITFSGDKAQQYWDIMVTDSAGNNLIFNNLDLFTISEVTLKLDNGTPIAEVK